MKKFKISQAQYVLVDDEAEIKKGDLYYSLFHNKVLVCVNENHAKALNLLLGQPENKGKVIYSKKNTNHEI